MGNVGFRIRPIIKDTRKLIAKEIELGFLRVPAKLKRYFPKNKVKIPCIIDGKFKELTYNPKYGRIFGLVVYFRKNNAVPNDFVEFEIREDKKIVLNFRKTSKKEKELTVITIDEAKEIIEVSELPSQVKGNIAEDRVGHLILLYGQGLLNVYKPISDIEGIDLIIVKKGVFQPIFIQVKSRYNLRGKLFQIGVQGKNFKSHHTFYIVGAYFNPQKMAIDDYLVFIPSIVFQKEASVVNKEKKNEKLVLTTSLSPEYSGKYEKYIIRKENLVNKIFEKFQEIEQYYK